MQSAVGMFRMVKKTEIRGRKKEMTSRCRLKTFYFILSVQFLEFLTDVCAAMKSADGLL